MGSVYEEFPSTYLNPHDLKGQTVRVVIDRVVVESLQMPGSTQKEERKVIYFRNAKKGWVPTAKKAHWWRIAQLLKEEYWERWGGAWLDLYPTTCRFGGDPNTPCIRVSAGGWEAESKEPPAASEVQG